jgi:hypothetical protein
MKYTPRPFAYWVIIGFLLVSLILLLAGQTMAIVDYDLAVALGLQESADDIGQHGVQVNRAFGTSDTFVYIPLIILSIVGLVRRKRWGLYLAGIPGYYLEPGIEYWIFMGAFMIFGVGGLLYLVLRGDRLIT